MGGINPKKNNNVCHIPVSTSMAEKVDYLFKREAKRDDREKAMQGLVKDLCGLVETLTKQVELLRKEVRK